MRTRDLMIEYLNKCNKMSPNCLKLATNPNEWMDIACQEIEQSPIVFSNSHTSGLGLINGFMDYINEPRIMFITNENNNILEIK